MYAYKSFTSFTFKVAFFFLLLALTAVFAVPAPATSANSEALSPVALRASADVRKDLGTNATARAAGPVHDGRMTWYTQDNLEAACGGWYSDNDFVVALPYWRQENCFRTVKIEAKGKTRYARAVDSCPTCAHFQLDASPALFQQFENLDVGIFDIVWHFIN